MDRRFAALLAAGALSGVATELAVGYAPFRLLTVFAGVWVVAGAWIGYRARSSGAAAAEGAGFLAAMVCAFYVTVIVMQSQLRATLWLFWIVVALTGGSLLGLAGWSTRAGGWRGGLAAAGLAGLLTAEAIRVWLGFGSHQRLAYVAFNVVAAVAVLCWPRRGSRWIAAVAFLPAFVAGAIVFTAIPVMVYGGSHLPYQYQHYFWHE
ncbi:MAG: hypothetical protein JWN52_2280 [Actinomycetia bacterium]|nr:hypothetical protein [Actinomycetes bacterium]